MTNLATKVWNPITGCSRVSGDCDAKHPFSAELHEGRMRDPLKWKAPRTVFVCTMGDLFHEDVPDAWIISIFGIMAQTPQHTYQILTKRPEVALLWFNTIFGLESAEKVVARVASHLSGVIWDSRGNAPENYYTCPKPLTRKARLNRKPWPGWPLPNVWIGVPAEDQQRADERIPILLQIPAAKRFVSIEPMLGPVDVGEYLGLRASPCEACGSTEEQVVNARRVLNYVRRLESMPPDEVLAAEESIRKNNSTCRKCGERFHTEKFIGWVICGGETGPGARPMHPQWARSLRDQCIEAEAPFFFKSWGEWGMRNGGGEEDHGVRVKLCADGRHSSSDEPMHGVEGLGNDDEPVWMGRFGKKQSGRLLDGREWNEIPR